MLGEEEKDRSPSAASSSSGESRKTYSRSVSWTGPGHSPTKSIISRPQWNSKARACLPPLSVSRPKAEEWPTAGSDDLGVWPNAPSTPGVRVGPVNLPGSLDVEKPPRDFEFKKDKLAFFDKECSRIAEHIYLGSDAVAKNRDILRQNGITHVLNCVGFVCPEYFKNDLVYKTLWLRDSPTEDITSILYDVFDYFEDVREQNGRVLVHCCQGVSRSTSLVIAYLMWREGQSFEVAFQYVKAARGVTNPNMGFACQLLQCQKRVHAAPASPNSVLRMYRMAPHSSYDPLHLVPKSLSQPKGDGLDSRGAFIVHVPSAIYVWIGKNCLSAMAESARTAASQVIRYESAKGPALIVREGEEPSGFWNALGNEQPTVSSGVPERKVDDYDLDFEIFHKVVSSGVLPPCAVSGNESETCLPVRENGWGKLREKFVNGVIKEFIMTSELPSDSSRVCHDSDFLNCKDVEYAVSRTNPSLPSSPQCDSPDSFSSFSASPNWLNSTRKEVENHVFGSPDSCSCFLVNDPKFRFSSPSLSPSTSDYSNSFTFSPSSSNWSDLSYLSAQPSPTGLEHADPCPAKNSSMRESACLVCKGPCSPEDIFSPNDAMRAPYTCLPCREISPSIAERRGSNPPPRMMLPVVEDAQVPNKLTRSWSFSLTGFEDHIMDDNVQEEDFYDTEDPMLVADSELQNDRQDEDYYDTSQCQN